ncbi:hypothetical protein FQZ97_1060040 [compost metagenome]
MRAFCTTALLIPPRAMLISYDFVPIYILCIYILIFVRVSRQLTSRLRWDNHELSKVIPLFGWVAVKTRYARARRGSE